MIESCLNFLRTGYEMTDLQETTWIADEFAEVDLGDARRDARLKQIASSLSRCPSASLPGALGGEAELEGAYRFFSNRSVTYESVLHPHVVRTAARCAEVGEALVLHDTTDIRFECYGDVRRQQVTRVSKNRQGFFVHASLAVAADGSRFPLGVLNARPYVHHCDVEDPETRQWWTDRGGLMDNEQERWLQSVIASEECAEAASLIHVCDREGDAYELLGSLVELGNRFVIRLEYDRRVEDDDGSVRSLSGTLEEAPLREDLQRELILQPRYGAPKEGSKDTTYKHTPRHATVGFRTATVQILRPAQRNDLDYLPERVSLNIVEVVETNPPENVKPIRWRLATTEPIATDDDIVRVVDIYRTRWVVEEFFKALKTGCAYEKRQLESARALLNVLAVTLPIAVHMLMLRDLARATTEIPAQQIFSPLEIVVMRALTPDNTVPNAPMARDAMNAIAKLGGHIPANGPPGWLVLYRGYVELISAKRGFAAAFELMGKELPTM